MHKFLAILLAGSFLSGSAFAAEVSTPSPEPSAADEARPAPADTASAPLPSDKEGIFSFLNFSLFKDKDPALVKEAETKHETFLQVLTRKANEGNVDAQLSLGYMYLYGDEEAGVTPDYAKAFEYYSLAANQGDNVALNNLGSLYYSGIGTKKNPYKAAILFTKAAELGNVEAAVNLAFLYLSGSGISQDNTKAINYFIKAADSQNLTAQYMLGYAYYRGFVVPQDYKKAFELIKSPAQAGFDEAQLVMAKMYLNGEGITKNYGNAVKYLGGSFMQGNVEAMTMLADILATGTVYPKNIYQAHILYNIASVKGAEYAASNRDALEKSMKIDEILQAQAEAEAFKETPKELTTYIRKTFGNNIKSYIDDQMPKPAETPKTNLQNLRQQQLPPQPVVPQTPASPTNASPRLV